MTQKKSFLIKTSFDTVIEAIINTPDVANDYIVIVSHPNSIQGGSMNNKVVTTIARAANSLNITSLLFNFRSVGESSGAYDNGSGEQDDLQEIIKFVKENYPNNKIILAGFSFGSYVSYQVAKTIKDISGIILIAPAIHMWDYGSEEIGVPVLIVHGKNDEVADVNNTVDWVSNLPSKPNLILFDNTTHFFHGKLLELKGEVENFLQSIVS